MEITIISAQGLKTTSSFFPLARRLRPFATVTTVAHGATAGQAQQTTVDTRRGDSPAWGDKFRVDLDPIMFYNGYSHVHIEIHTRRFLTGQSFLGWCHIPAADVIDGLFPAGCLRHLSYRLREKDGSRGHGVVNVAVKLDGVIFRRQPHPMVVYDDVAMTSQEVNEPVIGIPML